MAVTNSSQRAKFAYVKRNDIEKLINRGKIDANDIIYTQDTHENIFIAPDLSIVPVRSKIYRFSDTISAEQALNKATDTYEGQIVAIVSNGAYTAYIVNKNAGGSFFVTKLSNDASALNYDSLGNRPIENLDGTLDEPITVSSLATGIYKIRGQYKICDGDITTYLSANDHIFLVSNSSSETTIKRITSSNISDYVVSNGAIQSQAEIPTKQWITEQGYASQEYVDERIAALDFVTKDEIQDYVNSVIEESIDALLDDKIDSKLNECLNEVEDSDITNLF